MTTTTKRRCVRLELPEDPTTHKRVRKAFYGKSLKEAREKRDAYKQQLRDGMDVISAKETVAQWTSRWLETYGEKGGWSVREMRQTMAKKLTDAIGSMTISDVRQVHIQRIANEASPMSYSYVHKLRGTVQAIFRAAVANRIISFDPTDEVSWDNATKGTHRFLSKAEIASITANWQKSPYGHWLMIMLYAGLRPGELLGLDWHDIDFAHNVIHVRRAVHHEGNDAVLGETKTTSGVRDVPMYPVLHRCLKSVPKTSVMVATHKKRLVTKSAWRTIWKNVTEAVGVDCQAQDLRHTFCSLLYEAGVDVKSAQKMMGHASPEITMQVYTHLAEELEQESVDKMGAFLNQLEEKMKGIAMGN